MIRKGQALPVEARQYLEIDLSGLMVDVRAPRVSRESTYATGSLAEATKNP